jgi:hypothetical protein
MENQERTETDERDGSQLNPDEAITKNSVSGQKLQQAEQIREGQELRWRQT